MRSNPLLVDVGALSCGCTDHALETMAKAISGEDGDSPDIWAQHESPFIRSLIELFSSRGLLRIEKVKEELNAWLDGKRHKPEGNSPDTPNLAPGMRWSPDEMSLAKLYLQSIPSESYSLADWSMVIDYLVNRYLPASEMLTESEWLAVRSTLMGRVQANLEGATVEQADKLLASMPLTVHGAQQEFDFGVEDPIVHILNYGKLRCADQVVQVSESVRHKLKRVILTHQEQVLMGQNPPKRDLQAQLMDEFGAMNRDWRRIAVTESGENANQGLISSLKLGSRVRRIERYKGCCPFCKKINDTVMNVVSPADPKKNGKTDVWLGKTNIGRSAAPRKRVGDGLVERTAAERWWIPAGTVHPHCRGSWHALPDAKPTDDDKFQAWIDKNLHNLKAPS